LFELLQIFNCPDNFVEVLRLQVKNKFLHFWVIGKVVQGNADNLIKWYKCQEVVEVVIEVPGWQGLAYKRELIYVIAIYYKQKLFCISHLCT
jgi:hypothetical protein